MRISGGRRPRSVCSKFFRCLEYLLWHSDMNSINSVASSPCPIIVTLQSPSGHLKVDNEAISKAFCAKLGLRMEANVDLTYLLKPDGETSGNGKGRIGRLLNPVFYRLPMIIDIISRLVIYRDFGLVLCRTLTAGCRATLGASRRSCGGWAGTGRQRSCQAQYLLS